MLDKIQERDKVLNAKNNMWCYVKCIEIAAQALQEQTDLFQTRIYRSIQTSADNVELEEKEFKDMEAAIKNIWYFFEDLKAERESLENM